MCAERDFPLAILAKAPTPGRAKTRLIPRLGAEGAARLHRELVLRTLETAVAATSADSITLWTAHATGEHAFFAQCRERFGIHLRPQPEGDLGMRMHVALAAMPGPGLVIGSDCPILDAPLLQRCRAALDSVDCVFLPAEDGGYGLVGARCAEYELFRGIDWSTERVMSQTLARIEELGWSQACPATVWDVDRPEDIDRLSSLPDAPRWLPFTGR